MNLRLLQSVLQRGRRRLLVLVSAVATPTSNTYCHAGTSSLDTGRCALWEVEYGMEVCDDLKKEEWAMLPSIHCPL